MAKFPGSVLNEVVDRGLKKLARANPAKLDRDQLLVMGEGAPAMAREIIRLRVLLQDTPWDAAKRAATEDLSKED
jgi:hypothetical protein